MELVFEILNARQFISTQQCQKTFGPVGGVIGRGEDCDWIIHDRKRHLSKRHARVSFSEGVFFLTDTSGNGIVHGQSGVPLYKGEPVHIKDGDVYIMGDFDILARLASEPVRDIAETANPVSSDSLIPDDAFLNIDPLTVLEQQAPLFSQIEELINPTSVPGDVFERGDYGRIDMENLLVPELVEAPTQQQPIPVPSVDTTEHPPEHFWERFGMALGMDLNGLDPEGRETLAINVARLLQQSVEGLQQSLHTRSALKNELRLAQDGQKNPLKFTDDADHALQILLQPDSSAQLLAERAIAHAFRDLQAHQVALLAASRASLRATLEHFSPGQLTLRLEQDHKPLLSTSGRYWRAYGRYHQTLCQDDDWTERLLARDFARAYEEQIRLLSTLHADHG